MRLAEHFIAFSHNYAKLKISPFNHDFIITVFIDPDKEIILAQN